MHGYQEELPKLSMSQFFLGEGFENVRCQICWSYLGIGGCSICMLDRLAVA